MTLGSALLFIFGVLLLFVGAELFFDQDTWWMGVIVLLASLASCNAAQAETISTFRVSTQLSRHVDIGNESMEKRIIWNAANFQQPARE